MSIAYFSTWTTYGTWLPGDRRCWYRSGVGHQIPDDKREFEASLRMSENAILLSADERRLVERTIGDHCDIRGWRLRAAKCRTNHAHVLVSAPGRALHVPREQFKAWTTRRLNQIVHRSWWTERGWDKHIDDLNELADVMAYILEQQDGPRFGQS